MPYSRLDLDINSGDLRHGEGASAFEAKTTISESRLSKEIRRLGLDIPGVRAWRPMQLRATDRGLYPTFTYPRAFEAGMRLLLFLDQAGSPDGERRRILEEFMTSLRADESRDTQMLGDLLSLEVAERYGVPIYFYPSYEASLRRFGRRSRR